MSQPAKNIYLLIAEDDEDDFYLVKKAFQENCPDIQLVWVKDGEELMDYLNEGRYKKLGNSTYPVILLDLNMPRKDGRQALEEIKKNPELCAIPVVVLTTSNAPDDMRHVYRLGASAYVLKPNGYPEFVNFVKSFKTWLERISLPHIGM